jgi:hypothetical protein
LSERIALTLSCDWFHTAGRRLARWLLMAQDRVSSDSMVLTRDSMGQMLGVSRRRVSLSAGALQKKGLIHYLRGHINISNRKGLKNAACECYRAIRPDNRVSSVSGRGAGRGPQEARGSCPHGFFSTFRADFLTSVGRDVS